jgi:hypothetical protein
MSLVALLAACQTAPRSGSETRAQVIDVITDRHAIREGHAELHAALRAGVTRKDMEDGRLLQAECGVADASRPGGMRWHTATTLLPAGLRLAPGSEVVLSDLRSAWPATPNGASTATVPMAPRLHGRYVRHAPTAGDVRTPQSCNAPGLSADQWRMTVRSPLPAWSFEFAQAGLQRLDALSDADFAAARVLRVSCQLKVLDGSDWYAPVWVTRAPDGLRLQRGDVVRLRAGAEANSKDGGPPTDVLARLDDVRAPPGNAVVTCR